MTLVSTAARGAGGSSVVGFKTQPNDVSSVGTTYGAGADVLASAITFTADGTSSYVVVLLTPGIQNSGGNSCNCALTLDGSQSVFMGFYDCVAGKTSDGTYSGVITPTSGSHTVNVKLYVSAGSGKLLSGTSLTNASLIVYVMKLN